MRRICRITATGKSVRSVIWRTSPGFGYAAYRRCPPTKAIQCRSVGVRLIPAHRGCGCIGYLTSVTTASQQIIDHNFPIGEITPTNSLSLPISSFTNGLPRYFLFEAGAAGKGALTLTISQGTNTIAQSSTWFDFHDIK